MSALRTAAAVAGLLVACAAPAPGSAGEHRHQHAEAADPRGDSIYELAASFVDQNGMPVALDLYRGHPVLISMFYASCGDACPLLIADLHRIERELPAATRADLRVVLVSLDPERDTPEALRALGEAHGVDAARWRLLRAPDDTVREVSAVLGIKYRRLPDGSLNHSSVITLLDRSGVIASRVEGVGQSHRDLLQRLHALRGSAR